MAADYFVVAFVACVRSGCGGAEVGPSSLFITGLGKVVYIYIYILDDSTRASQYVYGLRCVKCDALLIR